MPTNLFTSVDGAEADMLIFGAIGDTVTSEAVATFLLQNKDVSKINVRINSPGGSVFEGLAIYNALRQADAEIKTTVEGAALSAASVVLMAGDVRRMGSGALIMVHDASAATMGNMRDHQQQIDMLQRANDSIVDVYAKRTGLARETLIEMMEAETWLDAEDALSLGFVDEVLESSSDAESYLPREIMAMARRDKESHTLPIEESVIVDDDILEAITVAKGSVTYSTAGNESFSVVDTNATSEEVKMQTNEVAANETQNDAPVAASYLDIKEVCLGADAEFICAQLEAAATVADAQAAWMATQNERLAALESAARIEAPGVSGVSDREADDAGDDVPASVQWREVVDTFAKTMPRAMAVSAAARKHPELRRRVIDEAN